MFFTCKVKTERHFVKRPSTDHFEKKRGKQHKSKEFAKLLASKRKTTFLLVHQRQFEEANLKGARQTKRSRQDASPC